jgi:alpha-galactosidase
VNSTPSRVGASFFYMSRPNSRSWDAGRISQDTGHTFEATGDAASGVSARYYMNRNFFVADPDAFTVSTQTVTDQSWHGGQQPLTLDEAKVSIALSAVSGGMFEIGDDLPTLGASPERLALVKNSDLIDMTRLGRASTQLDLLSYAPSDQQPSVFLLKETAHQAMLTVFNWTEESHTRAIDLAQLGLKAPGSYKIVAVFGDDGCCDVSAGTIRVGFSHESQDSGRRHSRHDIDSFRAHEEPADRVI